MITIRYRRPPGRVDTFRQRLVHRQADAIVTLLDGAEMAAPMRIAGKTALEPGAPIVWFTFPGAWHDIGRFHDRAGRFTGLYANILTPVELSVPTEWETTDLFLDVWAAPDRQPVILDEEELEAAAEHGWIEPGLAARARAEAERIVARALTGHWPPPIVARWTLGAARAATKPDRGGPV
ncbi:MAG: DUF402 domain-containing protein [Longimicrobiales bacterium]